jgi:hypothetical protein
VRPLPWAARGWVGGHREGAGGVRPLPCGASRGRWTPRGCWWSEPAALRREQGEVDTARVLVERRSGELPSRPSALAPQRDGVQRLVLRAT